MWLYFDGGREMIIYCTQEEKEHLIHLLISNHYACVFPNQDCPDPDNPDCVSCMEQNIEWRVSE